MQLIRVHKQGTYTKGFTPTPILVLLRFALSIRSCFKNFLPHQFYTEWKLAPAKQYQNTCRGFTLVEMLVAVSIFAIVMTISIGTLIVLLSAAGVAQSAQSITSNLSFAVDTIARHIRTGYDYYCTNTVPADGAALPSSIGDCVDGASVFVFTEQNQSGSGTQRVAYRFDSTEQALFQKVEDGSWVRLTSTEVIINPFSFTLVGSAEGDDVQPTVRILLKAEPADERANVYPFHIQTTVTSKQLNI